MSTRLPYQYVVLRCVPRVEREEFVNVGVVVYSQLADFLSCASLVVDTRLQALCADVDVDAVRQTLTHVGAVCAGTASAPTGDLGTRFGYLKAPRSTVVQPGPVHGGLTDDPTAELERLLDRLVRC